MLKTNGLGTSFVLLGLICFSCFGAGIYIEPGASLTFVRLFDSQAPGQPLRIVNINSTPMVYEIRAVADEYRLKGYIPMPDTLWVKPTMNNIKVEPYDTVDIPIQITIPKGDENFNRAWLCELSVMQSPWQDPAGKGKTGTMLQLGARATWLIETPFNRNLPAKGADPLSVAPSIQPIQYGDSTINKGSFMIKIRNDSNEPHEYFLETYIPSFGDTLIGRMLDIFPLTTEETGWILDLSWIKPKPKKSLGVMSKKPSIKLNPGQVGEYEILVDLPPSAELGNRQFEAIVLIKPEDQNRGSRFVRYIISPGLEYKTE